MLTDRLAGLTCRNWINFYHLGIFHMGSSVWFTNFVTVTNQQLSKNNLSSSANKLHPTSLALARSHWVCTPIITHLSASAPPRQAVHPVLDCTAGESNGAAQVLWVALLKQMAKCCITWTGSRGSGEWNGGVQENVGGYPLLVSRKSFSWAHTIHSTM